MYLLNHRISIKANHSHNKYFAYQPGIVLMQFYPIEYGEWKIDIIRWGKCKNLWNGL